MGLSLTRALPILALLAGCARPQTPVHSDAERAALLGARPVSQPRAQERPGSLLVFRAAGFPSVDIPAITDSDLGAAFEGVTTHTANTPDDLARLLAAHPSDTLVLPYGSAFPVDAWPAIRSFLTSGGGLVVLGGAPFHEPVIFEKGTWVRGMRAPAFANELLIGPAEPLKMPDGTTTWALTLRLTTVKEFPDEHGSAGPRVAIARPLVTVFDGDKPLGCALLELDKIHGARWMLATSDKKLDPAAIRMIALTALEGSTDTRVVPKRASISLGERAEVDVMADGPFRLTVLDSTGHVVFEAVRPTGGSVVIDAKLSPGLHRVRIERHDGPEPRSVAGGFWVKDQHLLNTGPKLGVGRDWITKDGKPFPIVGTTYMASDAHRNFLFEPNPVQWNADFQAMEKHGINFVRTGLWTAWSRVMTEQAGVRTVDEGVLSAVEAFVQTAAAHGIVVCFNLFAFLPPAYGGDNPYLDPTSLEGQKALVGALARRFAGVPWIHWDLINEPSYAPPTKLWRTRAIGDRHEAAAWKSWVEARHGQPSNGALAALWRDATNADPMQVPTDADFEREPVMVGRHPRKARDFREMSEEVVTKWASGMRATIRSSAGDALVTLGQDEGGIYERPTQQFLSSALDYTAVHTWWKTDDLLWDGVLTKVIGMPSLHQETGLMRLERTDGMPWRTPDEAAKLLERKLGYAFAARGTGVVEWVWNINPYMPIDEETTIGLFRPDGTAKPELEALDKYAHFFKAAAPYLADFEPDPVLLVIPHARAFLGLPGALDATKPVVRVLAERFGVVPAAMSDLRLNKSRLEKVKLIIVPNPTVLDEPAAKVLLDAAQAGTKVLITGAIEGDSYGRETPSLKALGVLGPNRAVAMHERSPWGTVTFEELGQETVLRADGPSLTKLTGNVWHEPLPLELAREREPLVRLLRAALDGARVAPPFATVPGEAGVAGRVLLAPHHALVILVNERPEAASRKVTVDGRSIEIRVGSRGTALAIVERATGKIIVSSEPRT